MKTTLAVVAIAIALASCKSAAWFETPNDLYNINGTLYLANGEKLDGKLSVDDGWGSTVKLYVPGEKKARRYPFHEVKAYQMRSDFYELKEIMDGSSFSRSFRLHFMRRLTPENSRIQLYEYLDKETTRTGYRRERSYTSLEKTYYIQFPSEAGDGVWDIGLSRFVPNFDDKMGKLVADCPVLAQKIANKEKGYFYPQFGNSDESRVDILWNIINEYNGCK
ncbi:MAG TPA: hypothetical protein VFI06_06975 [Chitinophagaceae bacterium]|nr:hypothetical protein [Chitinophagaceae bacterium]